MSNIVNACEPYFIPKLEEVDTSEGSWTPIFWQKCSFPPDIFSQIMMNLIKNPNINSSHVFRADILLEGLPQDQLYKDATTPPRVMHFVNFMLERVIVRKMIPRNILVDDPLDQTCLFYKRLPNAGDAQSLIVYLPHISSAAESPFYHPAVRGIAFLHDYAPNSKQGILSLHYCLFPSDCLSNKLDRTAQRLLAVIHKHGQGNLAGYTKRVHHDVIIPQAVVQNTYARLKSQYASTLIKNWIEVTDPGKHVFEDLAIAAFLIELWRDMYQEGHDFPGFVDIGCGNGLLVHILLMEGYTGWGFDARRRRSWETYGSATKQNLKEMVLIPALIQKSDTSSLDDTPLIHDGQFDEGVFIISNHADELTPWTPILATLSKSPFIMIPCCSHRLTGSKFRAPVPRDVKASKSTYCSLVSWVSDIAQDCGWALEKEMLRIPSTRNTALIGRCRNISYDAINILDLIHSYGGANGWEANALKLVKASARTH